MPLTQLLLDSWSRNCKILDSVCTLLTEENKSLRPSPSSWTLDRQLAHVHNTRTYFLSQIAPEFVTDFDEIADDSDLPLSELKMALDSSGKAVGAALASGLAAGGPMQGGYVTYENPVLFVQHMIWHEGWHAGQIFLALRENGQEPTEDWEEANVWGVWRTESWE